MNLIRNILVFSVFLIATDSQLTSGSRPKRDTSINNKPLILTPLIRNGQINEARNNSRVPLVLGMNLESYSGFFTVRENGDANLFFWFFPALNDSLNKPVVLWMDGGPGLSSSFGNFGSVGPYFINDDGKVCYRNVTWVSEFNLLFIDNPVGTGFSFAKSVDYYTNTSTLIAQDLVEAMKQFFQVFSEFKKNDFYIVGQSYAAKYAIVMADILTKNTTSEMNFTGLVLPSGLFNPIENVRPGEFLYETALIDKKTMMKYSRAQQLFVAQAQIGQYKEASKIFYGLLSGGIPVNYSNSLKDIDIVAIQSGISSSRNVLYDNVQDVYDTYPSFVDSTEVRRAIHVGSQPFKEAPLGILTGITETGDLATPYVNQLVEVLNRGLKTILVSGNMDFLIPTTSITDTIESLQWKHAEPYTHATRILWTVNDDDQNTAGYITCAANLCYAIVRNAGHIIPSDEPLKFLTIVERFINNKPFNVSDGV